MLQTINIQNFRGFKNLECKDLSRINLIVGKNNVGKTAFLEALFLFFGRQNPGLVININGRRGIGAIKIGSSSNIESPWSSVFYNFNIANSIKILGSDENKSVELQISVNKSINTEDFINNFPEPDKILKIKNSNFLQALSFINSDEKEPYQILLTNQGMRINKIGVSEIPAFYIDSHCNLNPKERAELFTSIDTIGKTDEIIEVLRFIEPRLKRLSIGIIADEPIIMADIGAERLVPLPLLGDGTIRLFDICIRIINLKNGALIIDEIENGFHHSAQEKIWNTIGFSAQKYNVQIFASTHSLECVRNAYLALSNLPDDVLRVHRIERVEDNIRMKTYGPSKLETIFDLNLEVR